MEKFYPAAGVAFCGGGLMQSRIAEDHLVDNTINFIAVGDIPNYKEFPLCSKCGLCMLSCPAGLKSGKIAHMVECGNIQETGKLNADKCLNCGTCSYVCLAGKNLSSRVRTAKEFLKNLSNA